MSNDNVVPELKEILGSLIFGSNRPLGVREMRQCLVETAKAVGGETTAFGEVRDKDVEEALELLRQELERSRCGFFLAEVAGGYRFQSAAACGKWLRQLLNENKSNRLSQPALETLAIIAYRQPVSKPEIELVRGVNVDHIIKNLLEMQLIRIVGRAEVAGRPFIFGTTQLFLEHFGLKDLNELRKIEPMLLREKERKRIEERLGPSSAEAEAAQPEGKTEGGTEPAEGEGSAEPAKKKGKKAPAKKDEAPAKDVEGTEDADPDDEEEEEELVDDDDDEEEELADDEDDLDDDDVAGKKKAPAKDAEGPEDDEKTDDEEDDDEEEEELVDDDDDDEDDLDDEEDEDEEEAEEEK